MKTQFGLKRYTITCLLPPRSTKVLQCYTSALGNDEQKMISNDSSFPTLPAKHSTGAVINRVVPIL